MAKTRQVQSNLKISRITPPKNFIKTYRVLGGLNDDLLLNVDDLTENEAKYIVCNMLDNLESVGVAIATGNLQILLKSLESLKKYYKTHE